MRAMLDGTDLIPLRPVASDRTQHSVTIEGYTLCSDEPLTEDEQKALGAYFRLLRQARDHNAGIQNLDDDP
jgi:hypothetical protein